MEEIVALPAAGVEVHHATMRGLGDVVRELLMKNYMQTDETTADIQLDDKRGQSHQAYLWQYSAHFDGNTGRKPGGLQGTCAARVPGSIEAGEVGKPRGHPHMRRIPKSLPNRVISAFDKITGNSL